jgi:glycosyltransferase involved in cell wall biosynthesis
VPDDWQILITAGRLEPQKAPELLIESFRHVVSAYPKTLLLMAGDGELRSDVEKQIAHYNLQNHVRILGFRNDVPDLLRAADVFVFSSRWEAMGRAMVEAMLLGKPVVVPAIYGIPEIVRHNETGLLYEVGQVDQLTTQLKVALADKNEQQRLGQNARTLTRRLFDVRTMVEQIEQVYDELQAPKAEVLTWRDAQAEAA